jgi:hypothetical protein
MEAVTHDDCGQPQSCFSIALLLVAAAAFTGCREHFVCDMTADGSVWLTVVRLVWAEKIFYGQHGRYGALAEMADLHGESQPGLTSPSNSPTAVLSSGRIPARSGTAASCPRSTAIRRTSLRSTARGNQPALTVKS